MSETMLKKLKIWLFKVFAFGLETNDQHDGDKYHHESGGNIDEDIETSKHADTKETKNGTGNNHGNAIKKTRFLAHFDRKFLTLFGKERIKFARERSDAEQDLANTKYN